MWIPKQLENHSPVYLALVSALESDIESGYASPGEILAPQRVMADKLRISVGTVVRAYTVAQQRGLVTSRVGHGTFIADPANGGDKIFFGDGKTLADSSNGSLIDLGLNVPPPGQQVERLGKMLRSLASATDLAELMRYGPHRGLSKHRKAIAAWVKFLSAATFQPDGENILLCNGAQHAMSVVCESLVASGKIILTENFTYPGIKAVSRRIGASLVGVEMDANGLIPNALADACEKTRARVLYTIPTMQNPTGVTMSESRRNEIVRIARQYELTIVEDDVYGFLAPDGPAPLAARLPEQTFYIGSFSKSITPGLRVGFVVAPTNKLPKLEAIIRAGNWMTSPLLAEITSRWTQDGMGKVTVAERRQEAMERSELAETILNPHLSGDSQDKSARFHLWLPIHNHATAEKIVYESLKLGVAITSPNAFQVEPVQTSGIRLCLGAPHTKTLLRQGLHRLSTALANANEQTDVEPYI